MHRAARIIFSLSFHLGQMTPEECIDYLVKRVGHELDNATAEVRRSFNGTYSPLYQAAYMLGGLQYRPFIRNSSNLARRPTAPSTTQSLRRTESQSKWCARASHSKS